MAHIEISGVRIEYDLLGPEGAHCVAVTPGGRMSMEAGGVRQLGEALALLGKRVLLWDRPNCGLSDLHFEGSNESAMQGRFLTQLIRALELGPTALAGGSAGSRCSLLAAVQDPETVSHLVQWWISGGTLSLMMLGQAYDCEPAVAASMGGMAAVEKLTTFTEQLTRNSRARAQLLAQDPAKFVETMERWAEAFIPQQDSPVPGMSAADWAGLKMPVLIFRGSEQDIYHHRRITEWSSRRGATTPLPSG
jgi:pimeloyl-ACP methyl ester carboxylesterase